ncbi:MAG TPA: AraC family transcriptional regulator, partial [Victivallales bacterium]|nr:AraC family transcriptional regulator [Victivallales bacterium]
YAGDVFLLRKGEIHSYIETKGLKLINILFKSEKVLSFKEEFRKLSGFNALFRIEPTMRNSESQLRLSPEKLLESLRLIELMENEIKTQKDGWSIFAKTYFLLLIALLSRAYSSQYSRTEQPIMNLAKVISFIEENPQRKMPIGELSAMANMSRSSFFREFLKSTGYPPHEYIIRIRVFKAMNEIIQSHGKISIKEASIRAGFNDSNYFSRIYKKIVNEPPSKTKIRSKFMLK